MLIKADLGLFVLSLNVLIDSINTPSHLLLKHYLV